MSARTDPQKRPWELRAGAIPGGGASSRRLVGVPALDLSQQLRAALAVDPYDDDSTTAVCRLPRQGAPINLRSKDEIPVFRFATERGDVGLVRECLGRGQSPNERSPNGQGTPALQGR